MNFAPLLPLLLLSACASQGAFPSLNPRPAEEERVIAAPGDAQGATAALAQEERQSVRADQAQAQAAFADARRDIAAAEKALAAAFPAAATASVGSEGWSRAQMLLSRLQDARAALAAIDAMLVPGLLLTDGLADADDDRAGLLALRTAIAAEDARSSAVAGAAAASLARG